MVLIFLMYVSCTFSGQLGNQLFEIATTLAYAWDHDCEAIFPELHRQNAHLSYNQKKIFFRLDTSPYPRPPVYFNEKTWCVYEEIPFTPDLLLNGYFECWEYFHKYREKILDIFAPSEEVEQYIKNKYGFLLDHPKTVAVHVRTFNQAIHAGGRPFIGLDYYRDALKYFDEDSLFVVFSDRINWCKKHFDSLYKNVVFVEGNDHIEDLFLMAKMKHIVMANSSFSWWGAYLCQNPNKVVTVPDTWVHPDFLVFTKKQMNHLLLPEWIRISNQFSHYPEDMTCCDVSKSLDGN